MTPDSDIFKQLIGGAVAAVSGAVAWVWRKVDGAATKEDLQSALERVDRSNEKWSETTAILFANAESDRKQWNDKWVAALQKIHDAEEKSHRSHVDLLIEIGKLRP